eukprot:10419819-Heterocapsa_arctica.AAC.1
MTSRSPGTEGGHLVGSYATACFMIKSEVVRDVGRLKLRTDWSSINNWRRQVLRTDWSSINDG